jgi:predicted transcriptional regulator
VSHELNTTYLSIRITPKLAADLKTIAFKEANTQSAVARRLIASGVSRELRTSSTGRADEQER